MKKLAKSVVLLIAILAMEQQIVIFVLLVLVGFSKIKMKMSLFHVINFVKQESEKNVYLVIKIIIYVHHVIKVIFYQMIQLTKKFVHNAQ